VAETRDPESGAPRIVAVGRLSKAHGRNEAEFAILVADAWQRQGLGTELLRRLVRIGRDEGLDLIYAEMLGSNAGMRRASEAAGFRIGTVPGDQGVLRAELDLAAERVPA
jgi:acetyltransferase